VDNLYNREPAVAYNNRHDEYLVLWWTTQSGGATEDIHARRVRADGTLLSYFTIATNAGFSNYEPDVAYSPEHDEYLVVYTYDSVITDSDIWARRVSWNGDWMSPEFAIGRKNDKQRRPTVAYNSYADEYLVVYENQWPGGGKDIDAERVRASDGTPLGWVNVAAGAGERHHPDVAYNPGSNLYLIAYVIYPPAPSSPDIYGKVASWNLGDFSPEIHICDDAHQQYDVAVAATSEEYLVVWEDYRNDHTIYARRLSGDGTPLGVGCGFRVSGSSDNESPAIAYGAGHGYLVVWERDMTHGLSDYALYGRYAMPGQESAAGSEFAIDDTWILGNRFPAVACGANGDCLMVEAGGNDIRGRLVMPHRVYLPIVLRRFP
jgi:hypothetical protein